VANNEVVSERSLAQIFQNSIIALDGIHKRGFLHRDLKLDNILLTGEEDNSPVKIIDFGHMCHIPSGNPVVLSTQMCGTPGYFAPESTYDTKAYSAKSDIWQMVR
jgi:serine/threonine-protein kinase Chk2